MDSLLVTASARPLALGDLNLGPAPSPQEVRAFCDSFARLLVGTYLSGEVAWPDADAAANHIYNLMIQHCGDRVPDYAWDVYLAFDVGECTPPGGDVITRPIVEDIARKFAGTRIGAKTAVEIRGYEFDWLASDENGMVATFSTAGGGYAPKAFLSNTVAYDQAIVLLESGPATTSAAMAPSAPEPNTWKGLAERGIFSYDSDPNGGPYQLVGAPAIPVHIDELPPTIADVARRVVLRGIRLGQDATISEKDIVESESD